MSNVNTIIIVIVSVVLLSLLSIVAYGINQQNKKQKPKTPTFADPSVVAQKVQQQVSNTPVSKEMGTQFDMPQLKTPTSQQINNMFDKQIATLRAPKKQKPATNTIETKVYTTMKGKQSNDPSQQPKTNNIANLPIIQDAPLAANQQQIDRTKYTFYDKNTGELTDQPGVAPNNNPPLTFELNFTVSGNDVTINGIKFGDPADTIGIDDVFNQNNSDLLRATFSKIVQNKQFANKNLSISTFNGVRLYDHKFKIPNDTQWQNDFISAMKYATNRTFMFPTDDHQITFCFTPDSTDKALRVINMKQATTNDQGISDSYDNTIGDTILAAALSDDAKATIITSKFCKEDGKLHYCGKAFNNDNKHVYLLNTDNNTYKQFRDDIIFLIKHSQSPQVKECLEDIKRQMCKGIDVSKGATNSIHLIEKDDATPPMQMIVCIQTDTEGHKTIKRIYDFTNNITFDFNNAHKKNHFFQNSAFKIDMGTSVAIGVSDRKITKEEAAIIVDALGTNYKHAERDGHQKWQKKKLRVGGGQPTESKVWTALRNFYPKKEKSVFTFETLAPAKFPDRYMTTFKADKNSKDMEFEYDATKMTKDIINANTAKISTYWPYYSYFKKTKKIINEMQHGKRLASLDFREIPKYQTFSF